MAQINTTFSFTDNASSQINKAVRSYENLANSVGETTRVVYYNSTTMRRLDDTYKKTKPKIEQVTQSSVKFNYQVKEQTKSIRNLKKELHTFSNATQNVAFGFNNLKSSGVKSIRSIGGGLGKLAMGLIAVESAVNLVTRAFSRMKSVGNIIGIFVKDSADLEAQLTNLSVALGNKELTQEMFGKFQQFAADTPFNLEQTVKAGILLKQVGIEIDKIIPMLGLLGDVSGGNITRFNRMSTNLMQILSKGFADQIDIKEFDNAGVSIRKVLKDMGVEGKISANNVLWALKELTKEGKPFHHSMWNMAQTFSGALAQMQDSARRTSALIGDSFNKPLAKVMNLFEVFFEKLRSNWDFNNFLSKIEERFNRFVDNLVKHIDKFVIVLNMIVVAVAVLTVVFIAFNWSVVLITMSVIALIDVLGDFFEINNRSNYALDNMGKLERSFYRLGSTIGYVVGVFKFLYNTIYNVVAFVVNLLGGLGGIIYAIATMAYEPEKGFRMLKASLMDFLITLLDVVAIIANTLVTVFTLGMGKPKWLKDFEDFNKQLRNENNSEKQFLSMKKSVEYKITQSPKEEADKWGNVFGSFGASLDEAFKDKKREPKDYNTLDFKFDPNGNLLVNDKSKVQLAEDFRDLLLQQARMRFYTYVNTVTPTVNVGGVTITEGETNVEDFIDALTNAVQGTATASAGVM